MKATIGTKHQVVIPKQVRQKIIGLQPGEQVDIYPVDSQTLMIKIDTRPWVERTRGIMREAWKDIDPIEELKKMRQEWDRP